MKLQDFLPSIEIVCIEDVVVRPLHPESESFVDMLQQFVASKSNGDFAHFQRLCVARITSKRHTSYAIGRLPASGLQMPNEDLIDVLRETCIANGVDLHGWGPMQDKRVLCETPPEVVLSSVLGYDG